MSLDVAVVGFPTQNGAVNAFTKRTGDDGAWTHEVAFVEHHHSDRVAIRGTFAGHYLDLDESDHLSQPGAAEGALTGVLAGLVFGPPGWASGFVLGGVVGAVVGTPTETESEPKSLVDDLRDAVPRGGSAILLAASPSHVDAMLGALADAGGKVSRRTLSAEQERVLEIGLSDT